MRVVQPIAFRVSFLQSQNSIDYLILYISFATFRWKETNSIEIGCYTDVSNATATHFYTLQHTATHFYTLQHTATHCNKVFGAKDRVPVSFTLSQHSMRVVIQMSATNLHSGWYRHRYEDLRACCSVTNNSFICVTHESFIRVTGLIDTKKKLRWS